MKFKFNPLDPEFLAQLVHLTTGAFVISFLALLYEFKSHLYIWLLPIFLVIVLFKEYYYDPKHEANNPFIWQGVIDFLMYVIGITVLGLIIYLWIL